MLVCLGLILGLLFAFLARNEKKEDIRFIKLQKKIIAKNSGSIGIKSSRLERLKVPGIYAFILILFLISSVVLVLGLNSISESSPEFVNVMDKHGHRVRLSLTEYLLVRTVLLIASSTFVFNYVLTFVINNVPYTLIFTSTKLIISNYRKGRAYDENMLSIEWERLISVSMEDYDYYTFIYVDGDGEEHECFVSRNKLALSESQFEKLFAKKGVKVIRPEF